jgi:hypothetical protein
VQVRAEREFILENYFASKSNAAVREAFSDEYRDKKVPNKTTVQRLVTFRDTAVSVCLGEGDGCLLQADLYVRRNTN